MSGFEFVLGFIGVAYAILFLILPWVLRAIFRRIKFLERSLIELKHSESEAHVVERRLRTPPPPVPKPEGLTEKETAPSGLPTADTPTVFQPMADSEREPLTDLPPSSEKAPNVLSAATKTPEMGWPSPELSNKIKHWVFGGHTLARIGVLILFFGVAFLLKYAVDRGLLPIELRLAAAAAGGFVLLGIGWRLREQRRVYGLTVQGGGIGIVYLTVFAAVSFYQLLPALSGQLVMVLLVTLAAALSVLQNARGLALFSAVGGFLAPILISSGGDHLLLFSYYALLNAGILLIAWFKAWRELNLAGFIFTFVIGSIWGHQYYQPEFFATTQPFLILFFTFYVAVPVLFALRQPPDLKGYVDGSLIFGVPLIAAGLQSALVSEFEYGLAISAFGAGLFYILLAGALWRLQRESQRLLVEIFIALGVAFTTLSIPFAVDGRWTGAAWALEGAALVWVGIRQNRLLARASGTLIQVAAGVAMFSEIRTPPGEIPFLNSMYLSGLMVSLSGLVSGYQFNRSRDQLRSEEASLVHVFLVGWGLLWWFAIGLNEIGSHAKPDDQPMFALLFIAASSIGLALFERRFDWQILRFPVMGLSPFMAVILIASFEAEGYEPLDRWGLLVWPFAFGVHFWLLRRYQSEWDRQYQTFAHALGFWLLVFLATWEVVWQTQQIMPTTPTWALIMWPLLPSISMLLVTLRGERLGWPIAHFRQDYFVYGLGPIALYLIGWALFATVQPADPAPLPYIPILNPVELMQLIALASVSIWSIETLPSIKPKVRVYSLATLGFVILNGVIARSTHYLGGVPYTASSLYGSEHFQSATSIIWTVLALGLTWTATRKQLRELWFAGTGLLALVVLKLFLIDLAEVGTIARIVSFIVVGVLILVLAYLSPLPPGEGREKTP
jgi:uncharacterized membrane protein